MKKTISINLAGLAFKIDEDAYTRLENYLNQIKVAYPNPDEHNEIITDVEHRMAELFQALLGKRFEVIDLQMVEDVLSTLGSISDENTEENTNQSNSNSGTIKRKLFRSTDDKIFAGVLGGLGVYLGIDAVWLRLLFVLLAIASIGVPVGLIYIVLWVVIPKALTASQKLQMQGEPVNLSSISENIKKKFK